MIKSKLIPDALLELPGAWEQSAIREPPPNPTLPEGFVLFPNTVYYIQHDDTRFQVMRPFRWLPYLPGKVTCMPLGGEDILTLTGQMSGCWVVIFIFNGQQYVGHIGTSLESKNLTEAAKRNWVNALNNRNNPVTPCKAYNPMDRNKILNPDDQDALSKLNLKGEAAEFYGAIEASGWCYTVVLAKSKYGPPLTRRVAAVVPMGTTTEPIGWRT